MVHQSEISACLLSGPRWPTQEEGGTKRPREEYEREGKSLHRIHGEKNDQARLQDGKLISVLAQATCYLSCNIFKVVPVFHLGEGFVALEEMAARDAYMQ